MFDDLCRTQPTGVRQRRHVEDGRSSYSDVEYPEYRTVTELDGRVGHEGEFRLRDRRRDNRRTAEGMYALRFGWVDVNLYPCRTAAEVGGALRAGGWTGQPSQCSSSCTAVCQ